MLGVTTLSVILVWNLGLHVLRRLLIVARSCEGFLSLRSHVCQLSVVFTTFDATCSSHAPLFPYARFAVLHWLSGGSGKSDNSWRKETRCSHIIDAVWIRSMLQNRDKWHTETEAFEQGQ